MTLVRNAGTGEIKIFHAWHVQAEVKWPFWYKKKKQTKQGKIGQY